VIVHADCIARFYQPPLGTRAVERQLNRAHGGEVASPALEAVRMNRSYLYVPGDRPERFAKAVASGADAVLIDLEDAVAPAARAPARAGLAQSVGGLQLGRVELWVRINAWPEADADLAALEPLAPMLAGVVLAKCESAAWLDEAAAQLPAAIGLAPLVESARALRRLDQLSEHPRVVQCHLGELDLVADLAASGRGAAALVDHARSELVVASASAGLLGPIGGVEPAIGDMPRLEQGCEVLAELGFGGRAAIHPSQVEAINRSFSPSPTAVDAAARLVAAYDAALDGGRGVVVGEDGKMIDEAVVRRARALLGRTGHEGGR